MYIYAVFSGRTQALMFAENLKRMGVQYSIINTPREISTSCGLAVVFRKEKFQSAKIALRASSPNGFKGFYVRSNLHGGYEKVN